MCLCDAVWYRFTMPVKLTAILHNQSGSFDIAMQNTSGGKLQFASSSYIAYNLATDCNVICKYIAFDITALSYNNAPLAFNRAFDISIDSKALFGFQSALKGSILTHISVQFR